MVIWFFKTTDDQIIYTILYVLHFTIIIKSEIWLLAILYGYIMKQWHALYVLLCCYYFIING